MEYETRMVRWLKGSSGLFSVPIIPSESDQNVHENLTVEPLLSSLPKFYTEFVLLMLYCTNPNTQSAPVVFVITLLLTLIRRHAFKLFSQDLTLLSMFFSVDRLLQQVDKE